MGPTPRSPVATTATRARARADALQSVGCHPRPPARDAFRAGRSAHAEMNQPSWEEGGGVNAIQKTTHLLGALDGLSENWARRDSKRIHFSARRLQPDPDQRRHVHLERARALRRRAQHDLSPRRRGLRRLRLHPAGRDREDGSRSRRAGTAGSPTIPRSWSWYMGYRPPRSTGRPRSWAVVQAAGRELGVDVDARGHRHHLRRRPPDALRRHARAPPSARET